jgi:hypothetical protein
VPATVAFTLEEKDLIPEGITYDHVSKLFFISSIGKEKIVAITGNGIASDFISAGSDSIMETLGMKVDEAGRRLWVVSNKNINEVSYSAVHVYNIDNRTLLKKIIVKNTAPQLFNDLVLTKEGDAYITDSYKSMIYKVAAESDRLETFVGPDSQLKDLNGIAISPDDRILYPATGAGIAMIDIATRSVSPVGDPGKNGSGGIDGIVFHKGSLYGIVNIKADESEMYVARFKLTSDLKSITEVSVIDKGNPLFNLPTTCVIAEDELYCLANTSLVLYLRDKSDEKGLFQNPLILKYKLDN